jgi:putative transposase
MYNWTMLVSGVKFRAYPTEKQAETLSQWTGCQRFIYNSKVAEDRYFLSFSRSALNLAGIPIPNDQQYSQFKDKELTPFLYDVPSQVLRNGAVRFMGAKQRFFKGLSEQPVFKKKSGRQSVWLTSELFRLRPTGKSVATHGKTIYEHELVIGTKTNDLGPLAFISHMKYDLPASIVISREAGKWFVSFSYEMKDLSLPEQDLIDHYSAMSADNLDKITQGYDRGVAIPVASSDNGTNHDFTEQQKQSLELKELRRKRYERQMARRRKGSGRWVRSVRKVARCHSKAANIRHDFAHKTSRKIVDSDAQVFVFEDLKVKNMTKAPAPRPSENGDGTFLPNGAAAKAGLNKAILGSAWGKIVCFTTYKARRANKLVITTPPYETSQECSKCSHTHPDQRISQALFVCFNCGHTENADSNAAKVIKKHGIQRLISGEISVKQKKRVMRLKKKAKHQLGPEWSEVTRGEIAIASAVGNRETPTTIAVPIAI